MWNDALERGKDCGCGPSPTETHVRKQAVIQEKTGGCLFFNNRLFFWEYMLGFLSRRPYNVTPFLKMAISR